ncbi:MAG: ethanolamine ammonia-lyase subunit EutC [Deltaproteobacteria bacterium]|nr:ethanolamine ammonia-lyase subunit EutC [Deltaproteobacteria bacterium]
MSVDRSSLEAVVRAAVEAAVAEAGRLAARKGDVCDGQCAGCTKTPGGPGCGGACSASKDGAQGCSACGGACKADKVAAPKVQADGAGAACDDGCKPRNAPPPPVRDPLALKRLVEETPSRIAQGRVGTRYPTRVYLGIRAEHAVALDAVAAEVPDDVAAKLGCLPLKTKAVSKQDYLLFPDLGRRLDDESRAKVEQQATRGVDIQVIAADGLSAWALMRQGEVLLPALLEALKGRGFTVGRPLFVRHARIGVQDEIGVLTGARATIILVGERPGLGTGDSLSLYSAYKPRLGQDNAEKNCISNVRPLGVPPAQAAALCADLMRRTFDAGGGGVHLVRPVRDIPKRQSVGG